MSLLIDGYNLLHATGIIGRGRGPGNLERSRQALLNFLVESLPPEVAQKTVVVFDASEAPYGVASRTKHGGLHVYFASKYADADSLIEELILADSAPKRLMVVSSDHRLQRAAKRRKAGSIDSDIWFRQIAHERAARHDPANPAAESIPNKPEGPFSPGEVEYWLRQFGAGE